MEFKETPLKDVWVVDVSRHADDRGFFARTWCTEEFASRGLSTELAQCSVSFNKLRGTVRGMHFQKPPHAETKLVRCTSGAMMDVIVDLRFDSETYLRHVSIELDAESLRAVYIPPGCAHGFQTLTDSTQIFYQISVPYVASASCGIRWNDPALSIQWPLPISVISERDQNYPNLIPSTGAHL